MPAEKTAREKVLEKYPTAFAHNSNLNWVRIRVGENETIKCSECGQDYNHGKIASACKSLGGAGNEAMAWEHAAKNEGLM